MQSNELYNLILKHSTPDGNAADITAELNAAEVVEPLTLTFEQIETEIGEDSADIVIGTLYAAAEARATIRARLSNMEKGGVNFGSEKLAKHLPAMSANWPDGLLEKLMSAGVRHTPVLTEPVTVDDVNRALDWPAENERRSNLQRHVNQVMAELTSRLGDQAAIAETLLAEIEAGEELTNSKINERLGA